MLLGRLVERTQQCAALHPCALLNRIDANHTHWGQIDHQPVIRNSQPDHAMSAATHADFEAEIAGSQNRGPHVRDITTASDQPWSPVDHRVPYRPRRVVARISRYEDLEGGKVLFLMSMVRSTSTRSSLSWPFRGGGMARLPSRSRLRLSGQGLVIFELDRFFRGQRRSPVERANHGPPGKDLSQRILALQIVLLGVKELAEDEVEGGGLLAGRHP